MILEPTQTIISFVKTLFTAPLQDAVTWMNTQLNTINTNNSVQFLGAFIDTFIPWQIILACIAVRVPLAAANFIIALVLRIKSFIPTMGH